VDVGQRRGAGFKGLVAPPKTNRRIMAAKNKAAKKGLVGKFEKEDKKADAKLVKKLKKESK
jgi:hypothetical protein